MSKHTSAPWQLTESFDVVADDLSICNLSFCDESDGGAWHIGEVTKANGLLIAAAPELLEQLKAMVRMAENEGWHGFEKARAAIAKAEGA